MENKGNKFNEAKQLHQSGKIEEALKIYLELIKDNPLDYKIFFLIGTSYLQLKNNKKAITYLNNSIDINPEFPHSYNSRGIVFSENKQFEEAINDYEKAISLESEFLEAHLNKGISLKNLKKYSEAKKSFEICIKIDSLNPKIYHNLGNLLKECKDFEGAKQAYEKAIELNNNYAEPYEGRADILQKLSKIKNDHNIFELSIHDYEKAFSLKNNLDYVFGKLVHSKMIINNWNKYNYDLKKIIEETKKDKKIIVPFGLLSLIDDPEIHLKNSKIFAQNITPTLSGDYKKDINENLIRIGYFSADFNKHAVSHLIFKMLCLHDKKKFKIYCYSYGFDQMDDLHKSIKEKVDIYRDIRDISDHDVALLARKDGIDIAIDLQGYTDKHRVNIFANRAAPLQVNYLGYPGSMGVDFIDYIIADKNLIPDDNQKFFSEKIIFLPHQYQVQNNELQISEITPTKKDLGLPEDYFVYCAINNTYKISPKMFDIWMRLLGKVEKSVLWLLDNNPSSRQNLINEAKSRGIEKDRLVFSKRTTNENYLAQFKHADVYLDTFVYNAGATASNALFMGVPVITKIGKSYTARMASSLLRSIDLPELITTSPEDYEKLAFELSTNPEKLKKIKNKLAVNRIKKPLFNTEMFTLYFEKGLEQIFDNYIKGKDPQNIYVNEN